MKKITLFLAVLSLGWVVFAQQDGSTLEQPIRPPVETPWVREDVGEFSDPIGFVHLRERDIMYSFLVFRKIDLRERMNHPLYFPTEDKGTWKSLAQVIWDAVDMKNDDNENSLPVYEDEFCTMPRSKERIRENAYVTNTVPDIDPETMENRGMKEVRDDFEPKNILSYSLKEIWFFDKKRSLQEVRILQINPMIEYDKPRSLNQYDQNQNEEDLVEIPKGSRYFGFILYDELRPYLAKQEVYNVKNYNQRISLDDLLTWKRMFSSYIIAEGNTYNDRHIEDYFVNARDQMLESERISNKIRVAEHDLWEF